MDVALVLDFSGSLDQVADIVIEFAHQVVQGLPFTQSRARVAVVSYSDEATLHFDFNEYSTKREVLNALSFRSVTRTCVTSLIQSINMPINQ